MDNTGWGWCHDCDTWIPNYGIFLAHANKRHAVTDARCPGDCQFRSAR